MPSRNEGLQSTNKELETARGELQTACEELATLKDELQHRNTELNVLAQELTNLLVGVDIPVLVLDSALRVKRFTPAAGASLNLTPDDVGRPFSNIASSPDLARGKDLFAEVTGHGQSIEREVRSRDGHRHSMRARPFITSGNKVTSVLVVLLDTEMLSRLRDKTQEYADVACSEPRKRELTVRALLDATPYAIIGVSPDGRIALVNASTEKTFGYPSEELMGQPVEILIPENAREPQTTLQRAYFANMQSLPIRRWLEREGRRKDGTHFPVEVSLSVIETSAGTLGVAFASDITQRKRLEQAALAHNQMETVGRLASGLAHDLNNLLSGILANSELALARLASGSSPAEELRKIRTTTARGSEIVRQLMVYAGQETETVELIDVSQAVKDMLELLEVLVSKRVRVETALSNDLRAVRANPTQIMRIVMNLITNASDAIGDREGVIRVTTSQVNVAPDSPLATSEHLAAGGYVQLDVCDDGRGMSPEVQAKVFDLFFTTKPTSNHGLGLAVVQRIVRRFHGAIRISSTPGRGTTFRIMLPCEEERVQALPRAIARPDGRTLPSRTILVVEDEDLLRQGISKMLQKRGYSVLESRDGSSALDTIRNREGQIDVLLLDITLPGASSREVYQEVKRLRPGLPVIVTSGNSEKSAAASLTLEIKHFLRKPFPIAELLKMIERVLAS